MWIIYLNRFFKQFRRQDKAAGKGQFTRPSFPSHIPPCPHSSHKRPIDRKKPFLNTGKLTHLRNSTVYNTDMLYNCFGLFILRQITSGWCLFFFFLAISKWPLWVKEALATVWCLLKGRETKLLLIWMNELPHLYYSWFRGHGFSQFGGKKLITHPSHDNTLSQQFHLM